MNRVTKEKDQSKVDILGPYATAISIIIKEAQSFRKDIKKSNFQYMCYRGTHLLKDTVKQYAKELGKKSGIQLRGIISTTSNKESAVDYAM